MYKISTQELEEIRDAAIAAIHFVNQHQKSTKKVSIRLTLARLKMLGIANRITADYLNPEEEFHFVVKK